jgi:hypothetical protein
MPAAGTTDPEADDATLKATFALRTSGGAVSASCG